MGNHQAVIDYMKRFIEMDDSDTKSIESCFKEILVKKRQFIVQPGFVASHRHYVIHGAFRSYVATNEGDEHTISFAVDDWWITDYNSYIYQKPATMFVVALEDSRVMQIDFQKEKEIKASHHKFETFFRAIAERGLASYQRRVISSLTKTAEERYEEFESQYPLIVQRVPQYALASFLGMSTEYLSKLRNNRVKRK